MIRLRRRTWKSRWNRPLLRSAMLWAGGTSLAACAVLLVVSVFEPGTDPTSGLWISVGVIAGCIGIGVVLTTMVTNPGWITGVAGAAVALAAAIGGWLVYSIMPEPGYEAFIAQRDAMAALAFGFGFVGGGLVLLGEMVTDGKVPEPNQRPPADLTLRVSFVSVAVIVLGAAAGAPAVHDWTRDANTDVSITNNAGPQAGELGLSKAGRLGDGGAGWGTPHGLLTRDRSGEDASVAYTMKNAETGSERWHHRRWDRVSTAPPVMADDGELVGISSQDREDPDVRYLTILDSSTGALKSDIPLHDDPGELRALTDRLAVYADIREPRTLIARDFHGRKAWEYSAPADCLLSAVDGRGGRLAAGLACRSETDADERARVVALDAGSGTVDWDWEAEGQGSIARDGMVITPDTVIADVRRDVSGNDSLFAARQYRHDLAALSVKDGASQWKRDDIDLGDTYAPACAGTLQLAGTDPRDGRLLLGECHQVSGEAGGRFDVTAYTLDEGKRAYTMKSSLGYAPQREADTTGWFAGLPDGRAVIATDASLNLKEPRCQLWADGPQQEDKREALPVPDAVSATGWCREVSLQLIPTGVVASFGGDAAPGGFFSIS